MFDGRARARGAGCRHAPNPDVAHLPTRRPAPRPRRCRTRLVVNAEEYGDLADDLAAVSETEPATGGFGPVLYGLVDQGEDRAEDTAEDHDGYLRSADEDVAAVRENAREDPETSR